MLTTRNSVAHGEAYNRKKLIHRDISAGNVLIYPELVCDANGVVTERPRPLLADWELAKRVDDPKEAPRQPDRTVSCNVPIIPISS